MWIEQRFIKYNERNEPVLEIPEEEPQENESTEDTTVQEETQEPLADATNICGKNFFWSYDHTLTFISAVESHYDDMHHPRKRKNFWNMISEELISQNIEVNQFTILKKLFNNLKSTCR